MCNCLVAQLKEAAMEPPHTESAPRVGVDERRVEREAVLDAEPDQVWDAISREALLEEWLADEVELDLVEGGDAVFRFADGERRGTVEEIEEGRRLAFTWERPGSEPSRVEFRVEALPVGTRLVIVESTPAFAASPVGLTASTLGASRWQARLAVLGDVVRLALVA
jgi:uncharacterized protein YndB with AHSA1/START domain